MDGKQLWQVTAHMMEELAKRKIFVKGVVSDMGPSNRAMWEAAGVKSKSRVATSWKSPGFFLLSWKVLEFCFKSWAVLKSSTRALPGQNSETTYPVTCKRRKKGLPLKKS